VFVNQIRDDEQAIQCSLPQHGCSYFFHRECAGLTPGAYSVRGRQRKCATHVLQLLMNEVYAEWICSSCYDEKKVSLVQLSS
jgi:hypothetical protein